MVTVAVVAILAAVAVPGLRGFVTRSGMNAVRDDFAITLQRARLDDINRNTCISVCQLAENSQNTCETQNNLGQWHRGWLVFVNDACTTPASATVPANDLLQVRQAGNERFQLNGSSDAYVTFNPRGLLRTRGVHFLVEDAQDPKNSPYRRKIALNFQGRVSVEMMSSSDTSVAGAQ